MATKITKDLSNMRNLVKAVREQYARDLIFPLKASILKDILRGVSPVLGQGKFQKYSESYKQSIRGETQFFTASRGGVKKVIAITAPAGSNLPTIPFLTGKRLSPVNLKLSGEMLSSFQVKPLGSSSTRRLELIFNDGVAVFHNKLGAGKSRVKRRLLPTESGERFNRKISNLTVTILKSSTSNVLRKFNGR